MGFWNAFVELIYSTLFGLAVACGGNMGLAIGLISLIVRLPCCRLLCASLIGRWKHTRR